MKIKSIHHIVCLNIVFDLPCFRIEARLHGIIIPVVVVWCACFALVAVKNAVIVHEGDAENMDVFNGGMEVCFQKAFQNIVPGAFTGMMTGGEKYVVFSVS